MSRQIEIGVQRASRLLVINLNIWKGGSALCLYKYRNHKHCSRESPGKQGLQIGVSVSVGDSYFDEFQMGREGRRAKTKTVLKSLKQREQLGNLQSWTF